MSDLRFQELSAEWLDHLILDMAELEILAGRLERSLGAVRPADASEGALSVQFIDVLVRVTETTGALHDLAKGRLRRLATAMAAASDDEESAAVSALAPEPTEADRREPALRRVSMFVR